MVKDKLKPKRHRTLTLWQILVIANLPIALSGCHGYLNNVIEGLTLDISAPTGRGTGLASKSSLLGTISNQNHACFSVISESGETISLIWPLGYTAQNDPLRVISNEGNLVFSIGDNVSGISGNWLPKVGCRGEGSSFIVVK